MANRPEGKAVATIRRTAVPTNFTAREGRIANEDRYRAQVMSELTRLGAMIDELRARIEALEEDAAP